MAKAKHIPGVDCGAKAATAIRLVLISRFEEMCALRDQALDWSDPEGVHDMRVASRRLRGALRDFMPYIRKRGLAGSLRQIKNLADALGDVRDQDVAIMGLQKLAASAPAEAAATLDQLVSIRETIRKEARRELQLSLRKSQLKAMQADFFTSIESATVVSKERKPGSNTAPYAADVSYRQMARSIIMERLKELEKLSDSLFHPLDMKPLHQMRIAAKRLRYALELFEPCWDSRIATFAKKVGELQSSLGELHDSDIWIESFGKQLDAARGKELSDQLDASFWLLSHFVRLHSKHLRNALAHWQKWKTHGVSTQLREYLKTNSVAAVSGVAGRAAKRRNASIEVSAAEVPG